MGSRLCPRALIPLSLDNNYGASSRTLDGRVDAVSCGRALQVRTDRASLPAEVEGEVTPDQRGESRAKLPVPL